MKTEIMIAIAGSFVTIGLAINAYFLRGIFSDLNNVKINIARMFERSKHRDKKEDEFENRLDRLEKENARIRERLHSLEGERRSLAAFIDDFYKEKK